MSIRILFRQGRVVFCALMLLALLPSAPESKERDSETSKSAQKKTEVKETRSDRSATAANTQRSDRQAKPSQDTVTPTEKPTVEPTTSQPQSIQPQATSARAGEQIKWQVLAGGGSINGMSTNYRLSGTVGQVAVGMGASTSYQINHGFWQDFGAGGTPSCCVGETGDVNADGNDNLTDLTLLVNQLFVTFVPVPCAPEANTNGDAACDLSLTDLTLLVNKLFVTFDPTALCSDFDNSGC